MAAKRPSPHAALTRHDPNPAALASSWPQDLDMRVARERVRADMFGVALEPVRVGRFAVLRRIGSGGMGVVHAGYDDTLDRKVAIKLIGLSAPRSETADATPTNLASARFALALWGLAKERPRALRLAEQARDAYRQAGDRQAESLAEVEAWLRQR